MFIRFMICLDRPGDGFIFLSISAYSTRSRECCRRADPSVSHGPFVRRRRKGGDVGGDVVCERVFRVCGVHAGAVELEAPVSNDVG